MATSMADHYVPSDANIEIETGPGAHLYHFENMVPGIMEILDGAGVAHRIEPGDACDVGKGSGQSLEVRVVDRGDDGAAFRWELVAQMPR